MITYLEATAHLSFYGLRYGAGLGALFGLFVYPPFTLLYGALLGAVLGVIAGIPGGLIIGFIIHLPLMPDHPASYRYGLYVGMARLVLIGGGIVFFYLLATGAVGFALAALPTIAACAYAGDTLRKFADQYLESKRAAND